MSNNTIPCPICHKQLNPEYNICPYCGADLSPEEIFFGDNSNTSPLTTTETQNISPEAKAVATNAVYDNPDNTEDMEDLSSIPFNSNYDHYYDDVLPAVIKETSRISTENILKTGTIIFGTAAIIIYLIFML